MVNNKGILFSILDGMPMSVYLKDLAGKLTYVNKYAKKFLGLSKSNKSAKNDFIKSNVERIKKTDEQVIKNKCYVELEEVVKLKNNDSRWYNIYKYPVYDENDKMSGICVIARDVELEKRAQ